MAAGRGATEQLAAFTRLLGLTLIVASHPVTLARALVRRQNGAPVLIDAPRRRPVRRDPARRDRRPGRQRRRDHRAGAARRGSTRPRQPTSPPAFAEQGASLLVATRLDMTRRLGGVLAAAAGRRPRPGRGRNRAGRRGRACPHDRRLARRPPIRGRHGAGPPDAGDVGRMNATIRLPRPGDAAGPAAGRVIAGGIRQGRLSARPGSPSPSPGRWRNATVRCSCSTATSGWPMWTSNWDCCRSTTYRRSWPASAASRTAPPPTRLAASRFLAGRSGSGALDPGGAGARARSPGRRACL